MSCHIPVHRSYRIGCSLYSASQFLSLPSIRLLSSCHCLLFGFSVLVTAFYSASQFLSLPSIRLLSSCYCPLFRPGTFSIALFDYVISLVSCKVISGSFYTFKGQGGTEKIKAANSSSDGVGEETDGKSA